MTTQERQKFEAGKGFMNLSRNKLEELSCIGNARFPFNDCRSYSPEDNPCNMFMDWLYNHLSEEDFIQACAWCFTPGACYSALQYVRGHDIYPYAKKFFETCSYHELDEISKYTPISFLDIRDLK